MQAGEQGPSCKTLEQIPNVKMIHVRFISRNELDIVERDSISMISAGETSETCSKKRLGSSSSLSAKPKTVGSKSLLQSRSSPSKFYPRSLSVTDMIKLGKLKKPEGTTVVNIYEFATDSHTWSQVPTTVEYLVEENAIGEGGFRRAYKATTRHPMFKSKTWVLKWYLPKAVENIIATGISTHDHAKKAVQMHVLARNFASQLTKSIKPEAVSKFGETFRYRNVYYGETKDGECVTVEEFIDGEFIKYLNNTGIVCVKKADPFSQKAECLAHFSHEKSQGKLLLVDIQGSGYDLFDPEIASAELYDDNEMLFCAGNLSGLAIINFTAAHQCNLYCEILGLQKFD